jgi:hypothetical protein
MLIVRNASIIFVGYRSEATSKDDLTKDGEA